MPGVPPDALAQVKRGLRGLFGRKKRQQQQQQQQQEQKQEHETQQKPTPTTDPPPTVTTTAPSPLQSFTAEPGTATKTADHPPASHPAPPAPGAAPTTKASTPALSPSEQYPTSTSASSAYQGYQVAAPTQTVEAVKPNPVAPAENTAITTTTAEGAKPTGVSTSKGGEGEAIGGGDAGAGAVKGKEGVKVDGKEVDTAGGMSATSGPLGDQMEHGYADAGVVDREVREEGVVGGKK